MILIKQNFALEISSMGLAHHYAGPFYATSNRTVSAEGSNGSVSFTANGIVLRRKSPAGADVQSARHIPFESIKAVRFEPVGMLRAGTIQFVLSADPTPSSGAPASPQSERPVFFRRSEEEAFARIANAVQRMIECHVDNEPETPER